MNSKRRGNTHYLSDTAVHFNNRQHSSRIWWFYNRKWIR